MKSSFFPYTEEKNGGVCGSGFPVVYYRKPAAPDSRLRFHSGRGWNVCIKRGMTSMKMNDEQKKMAEEIAFFMRRLYQQGLTTTSGGNISVRIGNRVLLTPGGTDKARMCADDIGMLDFEGHVLTDGFKATCEAGMHLSVLRVRPDINAIVHAHPVTASAFAAAECRISNRLLCESYAVLGEIGRIGFENFGTEALAEQAAKAAENCNSLLFSNHGAMTLGRSLLQAFDRLEVLENAAKATLICEHLLKSRATPIPENRLSEITVMK